MDRRAFLAGVGAFGMSPLILRAWIQDPLPPDWYRQALDRMKKTRRHGILVSVPGSLADRLKIAQRLPIQGEPYEAIELFVEAVFIFAVSEAGQLPPGWKRPAGHNRCLLAPDGSVLESDAVGRETLTDPAKFLPSFGTFLHGKDGGRLKASADAIRKDLPEETADALAALGQGDEAARKQATETVQAAADGIAPLLVSTRLAAASPAAQEEIRAIITREFVKAPEETPGPRLPFGMKATREDAKVDPCPPCGMMRAPLRIGFLTK